MKIVVLLIVVNWVVVNDAIISDFEWVEFKKNYGKEYSDSEEESVRYRNFLKNKNEIAKHNEKFLNGEVTFSMGINQYSDMTYEEFSERILMKPQAVQPSKSQDDRFKASKPLTAPASLDWRTHGYVTPVKNQGTCGSSYAFSAVGGLESEHFKKTRHLVVLSEQNVVDCSRQHGNHGCSGGTLENSFDYMIKNHGVDTNKSYPYTGKESACRYNETNKGSTCTDYRDVMVDEAYLRDAVADRGPISALIYASEKFQHYKEGIFYDRDCPKDKLNHAIVIIGYGGEKGSDYWLVKNSWGISWGEAGYAKMARNRHNNCGIASNALYPEIWGSAVRHFLDWTSYFLSLLTLFVIHAMN